ncbi:ARM repeat-containing protein [Violaceomyces palustris]|uniref:ARM repeat-containing protein n=1 Tax=Violaceomyces palustris TaxID=1673888 RepID=A0ACD0P7S0_9BASI|nr:ARM repeat-containing protein [Violaceomyces palustris]
MPLSPRIQALGHARSSSAELSPPHRVPSPIVVSQLMSQAGGMPLNPDPQHAWDSVWPTTAPLNMPGRSSSASPSSSPNAVDAAPFVNRLHSPAPPSLQAEFGTTSQSPTNPSVIAVPGPSTSPNVGRPRPRRPAEMRALSSSPTSRFFPLENSLGSGGGGPRQRKDSDPDAASRSSPKIGSSSPRFGWPASRDHQAEEADPGAPASAENQRPSGSALGLLDSSLANPIAKMLSPSQGSEAKLDASHALAEVSVNQGLLNGLLGSETKSSEPDRVHDHPESADDERASQEHDPSKPYQDTPTAAKSVLTGDSSSIEAPSTSATFPFTRSAGSPRASDSRQDEMALSESPPKTRSFIAMPPRSGYELSDDPDDVGSEEDGSVGSGRDSVSTNEDEDVDLDDLERDYNMFGATEMDRPEEASFMSRSDSDDEDPSEDQRRERVMSAPSPPSLGNEHAGPARPNLPKRPSLTRSSAVPLLPSGSVEPRPPQGGSYLSYFRDSNVNDDGVTNGDLLDLEAGGGESNSLELQSDEGSFGEDGEGAEDAGDVSMANDANEESLNTLERIFLFAKSEMAFHRVLVSRSLPDWIRDVELNDAVEYIIPLLNGLGTDELDVCAAFAPELSRIMWFFFRNCPLAELEDEGKSMLSTSSEAVKKVDGADDDTARPESNEESDIAKRPRVSVSTFTSLLCALLLNQNNTIAGATQMTLVQFFVRLQHRDPSVLLEEAANDSEEARARLEELEMDGYITHAAGREGQPVPHEPYVFDERARKAVELELLENVAFAIGRLSQDGQRDQTDPNLDERMTWDSMQLESEDPLSKNESGDHGTKDRNDDDMGRADEDVQAHEGEDDLPPAQEGSGGGNGMEIQNESQMLDQWNSGGYSPFGRSSSPNFSDYKGEMDEEAAVGRMTSVSLLAALCAEEVIDKEQLNERFIPEILRMTSDPAFFVRKEVAGALGPMAKGLDPHVVLDKLVPAFDSFVNDKIWHVRLAACFSLAAIFGRLEGQLRYDKVISSLRVFVNDVSRNVRSAALEIIGETIYLFKDDPKGVPDELVRFFLGEPFDGPPHAGEEDSVSFDESFGEKADLDLPESDADRRKEERNSLLADFGFSQLSGDHSVMEANWGGDFSMMQPGDPDRPLVMAFNLPAVVLTLGRDSWPRIQSVHADLSNHPIPKVRKSLASSLHEIAKIIGPEAAERDLFPLADRFFRDDDPEVRTAILENLDVLMTSLAKEKAVDGLRNLLELWGNEFARDWRLRERLAQHVPSMAKQFLLEDEDGNLVSLMQLALSDPVSAVRDAGVKCVPPLYHIFAEHDQVIADGFIGMVGDLADSEAYRVRVACLLSIQSLVESRIQRALCEVHLLGRLIPMGNDPVINVRIALARTVSLMCRLDELYASPQSRSSNLLSLIAQLARDSSPEVRGMVDGILTEDEIERHYTARSPPPYDPRALVLGPADGGAHRPDGNFESGPREEGDEGTMEATDGMYRDSSDDMDQDQDQTRGSLGEADGNFDEVEMNGRTKSRPFSFHGGIDGHSLRYSDQNGHGGDFDPDTSMCEAVSTEPADRAGNTDDADDHDEPHHLLGIARDDPPHMGSENPSQFLVLSNGDESSSPVFSLHSPQRADLGQNLDSTHQTSTENEGEGSDGDSDQDVGVNSPTKDKGRKKRDSLKPVDPFLAFVAGQRSQGNSPTSPSPASFSPENSLDGVRDGQGYRVDPGSSAVETRQDRAKRESVSSPSVSAQSMKPENGAATTDPPTWPSSSDQKGAEAEEKEDVQDKDVDDDDDEDGEMLGEDPSSASIPSYNEANEDDFVRVDVAEDR